MDEKLHLIVLDLSGITIEVTKIKKPKTFDKLKISIKYELKNVPNNYQIFYQKDGKNIEIVNDDETYLKSKDILFVKEVDKSKPNLLLEKYSSSKREILEIDMAVPYAKIMMKMKKKKIKERFYCVTSAKKYFMNDA